MTQQEFTDRWRHEISGLVLDAATMGLHGAELSLFLRGILRKVDLLLAKQYADLSPPAKPAALPVNGAPKREGVKPG